MAPRRRNPKGDRDLRNRAARTANMDALLPQVGEFLGFGMQGPGARPAEFFSTLLVSRSSSPEVAPDGRARCWQEGRGL